MFTSSLFGGYTQSQADVPMDASQGSPQKGQAGGDTNALIPVTIHMMENAVVSGAEAKVDGRVAHLMIMVGAVEDVNRQQGHMEFALNDSTGKMKARFFFPSTSDLKMWDFVQNGVYVTAVGGLKDKPTLHFSVVALHPVKSPDEISHHIIEVAHSSLRSRGKLLGKQSASTKAAEFSSAPPPAVAAIPRPMVPTSNPVVPAPATSKSEAAESGPLRDRIAAFLSSQQAPEGVAFTQLTTHFNTVGSEVVRAAINELMDDGTLYTTIDDDHFASV